MINIKKSIVIIVATVFVLFGIVVSLPYFFPVICADSITNHGIRNIQTAIRMYKMDHGVIPASLEELVAIESPRYLKELPVDEWGNKYRYFIAKGVDEGLYIVMSLGADGRYGGEGENSDIYSTGKKKTPTQTLDP